MNDTTVAINDALQLLSFLKDVPESVADKHQSAFRSLLTQAETYVIKARVPDHPAFTRKAATNAPNLTPKSVKERLDYVWQKSLEQQYALGGLQELIVQVDDNDISRYGIDSLLGSIYDVLKLNNEEFQLALYGIPDDLVAGGAA